MTDINHITAPPFRAIPGTPVTVDGEPLDLAASLAVCNHSPDGFAWGYGGSGPAQLALAILLRFTDADEARRRHQAFKWAHVADWPQDGPLDVHVDVQRFLDSERAVDVF